VLLFASTVHRPQLRCPVIRFPRFTEFPKKSARLQYVNRDFAPPILRSRKTRRPGCCTTTRPHATVCRRPRKLHDREHAGDGKTEIASGLNKVSPLCPPASPPHTHGPGRRSECDLGQLGQLAVGCKRSSGGNDADIACAIWATGPITAVITTLRSQARYAAPRGAGAALRARNPHPLSAAR